MEKGYGIDRRQVVKWAAAGAAVSSVTGILPTLARAAVEAANAETIDWSKHLIDSTMERTPDPTQFGVWGYPQGLYLLGQYLVYRRTKEKKLLDYIMGYVNTHVDKDGNLDIPIEALDNVLAANLLVVLYEESQEPRYKLAAYKFRHRFDDYPRTTDGGFWHATRASRQWQLWLDGNYMAVPFLVRYGRAFHDSDYTNDEAVRQITVYHKHLKSSEKGLLYHAYDESGKAPWADPVTHHSDFFWCRAIGWYGMTIVDTLDVLPAHHAGRAQLIAILRELAVGLAYYQDAKTGLWYQVVDKPEMAGNWTETSSSSMFTYILDVGIKRGYLPASYKPIAAKGYKGVLSRLTLGADGRTNLAEICVGTDVGDLAWYLARPRATNDLHGLGAFLLMNEEWTTSVSSMKWGHS